MSRITRRTPLILALALASPLLLPTAGWAETIYLRDGTIVRGKIIKQDDKNFEVQAPQGMTKVPKIKVSMDDIPNPWISLGLGLAFPGAGLAYAKRQEKASFYAGLAGACFAMGFGINELAMLGAPGGLTGAAGTSVISGVVSALTPWGLGAWEAYNEAIRQAGEPKYRIEYGEN